VSAVGQRWRHGLLASALLGPLVVLVALDPIAQDPAYHEFADTRALFGAPNSLDVLSNFAFLAAGVLGLLACRRKAAEVGVAWWVFFVSVSAVSLGSAYYHWDPTDATLVWDRLPIATCFASLVVALLAEHAYPRAERLWLLPALAVGVLSVLYWQQTGDLRLYVWVAFMPLVAIPALVLLFPSRYTRTRDLWLVLLLFVLSRAFEVLDRAVFDLTGGHVSGHTIKHLIAAGAIAWIARMVWLRSGTGTAKGTGTEPAAETAG
jgi:hypothetical protein